MADTLHADTLLYDARGRIVEALPLEPGRFTRARNRYSGLGHLVEAENVYDSGGSDESWQVDPLGNIAVHTTDTDAWTGDGTYHYDSLTGRLKRRDDNTQLGDTLWYDAAGNQDHLARRYVSLPSSDVHLRQRSYFDAAGTLRVLDRQTNQPVGSLPRDLSMWEEYRYDALGRRVLLRNRYRNGCDYAALQCAIQRFVWDGDQLLYETRYPGGDSYTHGDGTISYLDADTMAVRNIRVSGKSEEETDTSYLPYWGRAGYTHGLALDRPLDVIRMGFGEDSVLFQEIEGPMIVRPHENWRGAFDTGTFDDGLLERQRGRGSGQLLGSVRPDALPADVRPRRYAQRVTPGWSGRCSTLRRR